MSDEPKVSVLLPVYNAERYVALAVRSVLDQTLTDIEVIAIDDGSTDGSLAILRELAAADDRLRVVSRPNTGYTVALNEAIGLSRAPLLARMDADDISLPDRLAKQVAFLEAHPNAAAVGAAAQFIAGDVLQAKVLRHPTEPAAVRAALQKDSAIVHPSVLMRKSVVQELGGYRPIFEPAEDYDLWLRMSERYDLANLPDVLLHYRVHAGQVSFQRMQRQTLARLGAQAAARRRVATGADPVQAGDTLEIPALVRWGAELREILYAVLAALTGQVDSLLSSRQPDAADKLLQDVQPQVFRNHPTRANRAEIAWLHAKIARARGRRALAAFLTGEACLLEPSRLIRAWAASKSRNAPGGAA